MLRKIDITTLRRLKKPLVWFKPEAARWQDTARSLPAVADTDPVACWDDMGPLGQNAVQATAGSRPTLRLNVKGGKAVMRFDGVDDTLQTPTFGTQYFQPFTTFVVFKQSAPATANKAVVNGSSASFHANLLRSTTGSLLSLYFGTTVINITPPGDTNFHVMSWVADDTRTLYAQDGSAEAVVSATPGTTSNSGVTLGASPGGTSFSSCDIAEYALFIEPLSASERFAFRSYLNAKYGLY